MLYSSAKVQRAVKFERILLQENATAPFFVELTCTGTSIIFSAIGIYLNLVLARTLFKSTLLTTSHRRTIRFFSYIRIALGVFVVVTSGKRDRGQRNRDTERGQRKRGQGTEERRQETQKQKKRTKGQENRGNGGIEGHSRQLF